MSKSKISPKTQKLLLGLVLLAVVAVIVFFFPELLPTGDDVFTTVPSDSTAASPTTPASTTKAAPPDTTESPETTKVSETTKATETTKAAEVTTTPETERKLDRNGSYTSRDDVALYIHQYGKLPGNFITKAEAQKLGWSGGSLEKYAPGKSIGGDRFGNYEGKLPKKSGRTYTECDIDTRGASARGAKRIVFSNDGLIYYTDDHYNTFTLLYGNEN